MGVGRGRQRVRHIPGRKVPGRLDREPADRQEGETSGDSPAGDEVEGPWPEDVAPPNARCTAGRRRDGKRQARGNANGRCRTQLPAERRSRGYTRRIGEAGGEEPLPHRWPGVDVLPHRCPQLLSSHQPGEKHHSPGVDVLPHRCPQLLSGCVCHVGVSPTCFKKTYGESGTIGQLSPPSVQW